MSKWKNLIVRHGSKLCALALIISPFVSGNCRCFFYQPEEPEGLAEFAKRAKKN